MTDNSELIELAKTEAYQIRFDKGIPVRVISREGFPVVWSKVDDNNKDLTTENSDGLLYHVRSVFVPHGAANPLQALEPKPIADGEVREVSEFQDEDTLGVIAIRECLSLSDKLNRLGESQLAHNVTICAVRLKRAEELEAVNLPTPPTQGN